MEAKLLCKANGLLLTYTPKLWATDHHPAPSQRLFSPSSVFLTLVLLILPEPPSLVSLTSTMPPSWKTPIQPSKLCHFMRDSAVSLLRHSPSLCPR